MSFEAYEVSQETGEPIDLIELRLGSDSWFYTNNKTELTVTARLYLPLAIKRSRIVSAHEGQKTERMEISMPGDNEFVSQFVSMAPGRRPTAVLKRIHRQDVDVGVVVEYRGVVQSVDFEEHGDLAKIQVAALTSARSRTIPRRTFQGLCGHMLYDNFCKIDENDPLWEKFLTVTDVNGQDVTLSGADAFGFDFFVNGFVQYGDDYRMVTGQTGNVLRLLLPLGENPVGQTVRALAGCKHRRDEDCFVKFDNILNYGGFPTVPTKNVFNTGLD